MRFLSLRRSSIQNQNQNQNAIAQAARQAIEPLEHRMLFAAGDLDPSFGDDGARIGSNEVTLTDIVSLSNGRSIVVGQRGNDFYVAKHTSDGSLDTSFGGGDGVVRIDFSGRNDRATSVAVQENGGIVIGGRSAAGGEADYALVRLTANGAIDTSFGTAGRVRTDVGADDLLSDLLIDDDGNIIAAGRSISSGDPVEIVIARYDSSGALDTDFGTSGLARSDFEETALDHDVAVHFDADGNIIGVGAFLSDDFGDTSNFGIFRFTASGDVLTEFDNNGIQRFNFREDGGTFSDDIASAIIIQDDGKFLIAGTVDGDLGLVRMLADGTPDPAFGGGDGRVTTSYPVNNRFFNDVSLALQSNGQAVLGATVGRPNHPQRDLVLVSFTLDGVRDSSFGDDGIVTSDFAGNEDLAPEQMGGVALDPQGRILVAGTSDERPLVARYLPASGPLVINGTGEDDEIRVSRDGTQLVVEINGQTQTHGFVTIDEIVVNGRAGNDLVVVGKNLQLPAVLSGGKGADTLRGGAGDDELNGNSGQDRLFGRAGTDSLVGGKAGDTLDGGKGADELTGNTGHDRLLGKSGADTLVAGKGNDTLNGGSGDDELRGESGDDRFFSRDSIVDRLFGGKGTDAATADGNDILSSIEELLA